MGLYRTINVCLLMLLCVILAINAQAAPDSVDDTSLKTLGDNNGNTTAKDVTKIDILKIATFILEKTYIIGPVLSHLFTYVKILLRYMSPQQIFAYNNFASWIFDVIINAILFFRKCEKGLDIILLPLAAFHFITL